MTMMTRNINNHNRILFQSLLHIEPHLPNNIIFGYILSCNSCRLYSRMNDRFSNSKRRTIPSSYVKKNNTQSPQSKSNAYSYPNTSINTTPLNTIPPQLQPEILPTTSTIPHVANIPVHFPPASSSDILTKTSSAASVLSFPGIMIGRQMEMLNVLIGFEQANKYAIKVTYNII